MAEKLNSIMKLLAQAVAGEKRLPQLFVAAIYNKKDMAEILLTQGVDVNTKIDNDLTALIYAAYYGYSEMVSLLLNKGANPKLITKDKISPVALCAYANDFANVKRMCEAGVDLNVNGVVEPPVFGAIHNNNLEMLKYLVDRGADLNIVTLNGETTLSVAMEKGSPEIVTYVLDRIDLKSRTANFDVFARVAIQTNNMNLLNRMAKEKEAFKKISPDVLLEGIVAIQNPKAQLDLVSFFIKNGIDINKKGTHGYTPLMLAIESGNIELAKLLIKNGAKTDVEDTDGRTALCWALRTGNVEMTDLLLSSGANPNEALKLPAFSDKNIDVILPKLIGAGLKVENQPKWTTMLMYANYKICDALLKNGVSPDFDTVYMASPLSAAIQSGDVSKTKLLLMNGADIYNKDMYVGKVLYSYLSMVREPQMRNEMLKAFVDVGYSMNNREGREVIASYPKGSQMRQYLENAQAQWDKNMAEAIKNDKNVNKVLKNGDTALIKAARNGDANWVRMLLEHGADANVQNNDGNSALMYAVHTGNVEMVDLLLSYKANPNVKDKIGQTLLDLIEPAELGVFLPKLAAAGMDLNVKDENDETLLMNATTQLSAFLLKHGANPDIQDKDGNTALMRAIEKGDVHKMDVLLTYNAQVDIANKKGEKPVFAAINTIKEPALRDAVVRVLVKKGASMEGNDETLFDYYQQGTEMYRFLKKEKLSRIRAAAQSDKGSSKANTNNEIIKGLYKLMTESFEDIQNKDPKALGQIISFIALNQAATTVSDEKIVEKKSKKTSSKPKSKPKKEKTGKTASATALKKVNDAKGR